MGTNKVILVGNLGKTPEIRYTAQNLAVSRLRLATNERRKNSDGEYVEYTEWHTVVVFGRMAENCAQYLRKGSEVYIEGRLHTNKWQDKDGENRWTTEVIATSVQFLGRRAQSETSEHEQDEELPKTEIMKLVQPAESIGAADPDSLDVTSKNLEA